MPGIRLHHRSARNQTVAVECFRAYIGPYECPLCQTVHHHKTVHMNLDNEGDVIVSSGVWEDLKDVPDLPLSIVNDVAQPPHQFINTAAEPAPPVEIEVHPFQGRR